MHNDLQGVSVSRPFVAAHRRTSQDLFSAPNACRTSASIFGFRGPWQNSMRPNIWQASKRPAALSVGAATQVYGCVPNDEEIGAHVRAFLWPDGTGVFRAEFPNKSSLAVHERIGGERVVDTSYNIECDLLPVFAFSHGGPYLTH